MRGTIDAFVRRLPSKRQKTATGEIQQEQKQQHQGQLLEQDDYALALELQRQERELFQRDQDESSQSTGRCAVQNESQNSTQNAANESLQFMPEQVPVAGTNETTSLDAGSIAKGVADSAVEQVWYRPENHDQQMPHLNDLNLDVDPLQFDLQSHGGLFIPADGEKVYKASYALLVRCFCLVNSTRSRIRIINTLTNLFRLLVEFDQSSLLPAVYLSSNSISPSFVEQELNIGPSIFAKALKTVSGISAGSMRLLWNKYGDPGDVAFHAKTKLIALKQYRPLLISSVYDSLVKIAKMKGCGVQEQKQRIVERLLLAAKGEELRYLSRTLLQNLRIGSVKTTILIALSRAFTLRSDREQLEHLRKLPKDELADVYRRSEELVKRCFARRPSYDDLVNALIDHPLEELDIVLPIRVGVPIKPMLGTITRDLNDILTRLQGRKFAAEFKYDGQRAQLHCDSDGGVKIFSRHLEDMTLKYPDIIAIVPEIKGAAAESFILEGEIVAVDKNDGSIQTFQTLTNRSRKNVTIDNVKVDVCLFAFDLMYLNGEVLLGRTFRERREILRSLFSTIKHRFDFVANIDATDGDQDALERFFKASMASKCEGIMIKPLDNPVDLIGDAMSTSSSEKSSRRKPLLSTYQPEKRAENWLKVKKDYDTGSDSLDLVPIGAWYGQGRKAGWYSPILLAVRNSDNGELDAVCKCISGFTDVFYIDLRKRYAEDSGNCILNRPPSYNSPLIPDGMIIRRVVKRENVF